MRKQAFNLVLRWGINSLGLWMAASVLGSVSFEQQKLSVILIAGLILAIINAVLRPVVIILSLPAIVLSLGLFIVVVNGFMIFVLSKLYDRLELESFGAAIVTGLVIGLVNFLVTKIVEPKE